MLVLFYCKGVVGAAVRGEVNITGITRRVRFPGLVLNDETYLSVSWKKWPGEVFFYCPGPHLPKRISLKILIFPAAAAAVIPFVLAPRRPGINEGVIPHTIIACEVSQHNGSCTAVWLICRE